MSKNPSNPRREFVKKTGAAVLATSIALPNIHIAAERINPGNSETLKVGLIGCGGRGTGAALQATKADPNVHLTAMADLFGDQIISSLNNLKQENPSKVQVSPDHQFVGFDAYKKLLATDVDVVILATPPSFRPGHLAAAVEASKHVFCEKPVAVDAPGIRQVLETAKKAKAKGLALMSGFCWRFETRKRDTMKRVLDGKIGNVTSVYNTYNTGALWYKEPKSNWSDKEIIYRNWLYYNWLSGDHIVEQAVHSVDLMSWALGDIKPIQVTGTGGRQSRTEDKYGNVYDHFSIIYEYPNGVNGYHISRQQQGCSRDYGIDIMGTKGRCEIDVSSLHRITRKGKVWDWEGEKNNMYQTEHDELFASIRAGSPFYDGEQMAYSTLLAIWGRMAAYTGQTIKFNDALNSNEALAPKIDDYSWDMDWPMKKVALPGITKFA